MSQRLLYRPDVCKCTVPYIPRTVPAYAVRDGTAVVVAFLTNRDCCGLHSPQEQYTATTAYIQPLNSYVVNQLVVTNKNILMLE